MRWVDFKDSVKRFWSDYKHQKSGMLGISLLIILVILALAAPFITSSKIPKEWQNPTSQVWITNPKNAPPSWVSYFSSVKKAPELIVKTNKMVVHKTVNNEMGMVTYNMTFTYNMKYAVPPRDIVIIGLKSNSTLPSTTPEVTVYVQRPSEEGVKNRTMILLYKNRMANGNAFQLNYNSQTKKLLLYWLYENGVFHPLTPIPTNVPTSMLINVYLTQMIQFNQTLSTAMTTMLPVNIIFGKITTNGHVRSLEDILNSYKPLNGPYKFTIIVTAPKDVNIDFSDFKVAFVGNTYGLLGTDQYARPIAVGLLWGIRVALSIGLSVAISSVLIGILIGVTSAYLGGWADEGIQRFTEFMMTFPYLPTLVLFSLYFGGKITLPQLVGFLVLFGWMGTTKVARSMALQVKEQTYVEAAKALGAGTGRIVFKHIVPQLLPYAFASMALSVPGAILAEASLSFLNLTSKNLITWGQMLNAANSNSATINGYWWQVIPPGLAIAVVGLVFVLIGVSLDKVLNPRLRRA